MKRTPSAFVNDPIYFGKDEIHDTLSMIPSG
jgi:hypothetical protein